MALLVTQAAALAGTAPSFVAASGGGDTLPVGADSALYVKNGSGGSITVTVASPGVCNQGSTHPLVVAVPAGTERIIGPLTPSSRFADPVTGLASVTYSGVTSLTVAVIQA